MGIRPKLFGKATYEDDAHVRQPSSFEEFWPYYVGEHGRALTRLLHFMGTGLALLLLAMGILLSGWLLIAAPVVGYGVAWLSHLLVEKNRPATFGHPFWSLRGDLRMFRLMLLRRMEAEIRRLGKEIAEP